MPGTMTVNCPWCNAGFDVPEAFAGKRGPCPGCGTAITIPAPGQAAVRSGVSAPAGSSSPGMRGASSGSRPAEKLPSAVLDPTPIVVDDSPQLQSPVDYGAGRRSSVRDDSPAPLQGVAERHVIRPGGSGPSRTGGDADTIATESPAKPAAKADDDLYGLAPDGGFAMDLSGLTEEEPVCPRCKAGLPKSAMVCRSCGYSRQSASKSGTTTAPRPGGGGGALNIDPQARLAARNAANPGGEGAGKFIVPAIAAGVGLVGIIVVVVMMSGKGGAQPDGAGTAPDSARVVPPPAGHFDEGRGTGRPPPPTTFDPSDPVGPGVDPSGTGTPVNPVPPVMPLPPVDPVMPPVTKDPGTTTKPKTKTKKFENPYDVTKPPTGTPGTGTPPAGSTDGPPVTGPSFTSSSGNRYGIRTVPVGRGESGTRRPGTLMVADLETALPRLPQELPGELTGVPADVADGFADPLKQGPHLPAGHPALTVRKRYEDAAARLRDALVAACISDEPAGGPPGPRRGTLSWFARAWWSLPHADHDAAAFAYRLSRELVREGLNDPLFHAVFSASASAFSAAENTAAVHHHRIATAGMLTDRLAGHPVVHAALLVMMAEGMSAERVDSPAELAVLLHRLMTVLDGLRRRADADGAFLREAYFRYGRLMARLAAAGPAGGTVPVMPEAAGDADATMIGCRAAALVGRAMVGLEATAHRLPADAGPGDEGGALSSIRRDLQSVKTLLSADLLKAPELRRTWGPIRMAAVALLSGSRVDAADAEMFADDLLRHDPCGAFALALRVAGQPDFKFPLTVPEVAGPAEVHALLEYHMQKTVDAGSTSYSPPRISDRDWLALKSSVRKWLKAVPSDSLLHTKLVLVAVRSGRAGDMVEDFTTIGRQPRLVGTFGTMANWVSAARTAGVTIPTR